MQPKIYTANEHGITPDFIDPDALEVLTRLHEAGFVAYIVGGGVRDLLIKKTPKDFDISTSASPNEIKRIFRRRCILIGKRFRLAHILFGRKSLEVSTFRSGDANDSELIVRDNRWGTPEQDVLRRDFTVNGLFYDVFHNCIIDFVDGWKDIHKGILRTIGHPEFRFKQDPVRMIRALKFRARFGFSIHADTEKALLHCKEEISKSSSARILEELFKMLESGAAAPFFQLMTDYGLLEILFSSLTHFLTGPHSEEIYRFLIAADNMHRQHFDMVLERGLLISCLLYPIVNRKVKSQYLSNDLIPHIGDIIILTSSVIKEILLSSFSHFPSRDKPLQVVNLF